MARVTKLWFGVVMLVAVAAAAEDRLAVLEFFGRPGGQFCGEAAPAMIALQGEYEGRALLLEYDYDAFRTGRVDRWWVAYPGGGGTVYLPLVIVGSGYRWSMGPVNYLGVYRSMLEDELARPPAARIEAYWRQMGQVARAYVRVENRSGATLRPEDDAAVWLLLWEDARLGLTDTWVRASAVRPLTEPLAPGASTTVTVDAAPISAVDWGRVRSLALVEQRADGDVYDMLQAAVTIPAGLGVSPTSVAMTAASPVAEVTLSGPAVLSWTASSDAPWVDVRPAAGSVPASVTLALRPGAVPSGPQSATVRFDAAGDGMSFSEAVRVSAEGPVPLPPRRVRGRFGSAGER